MSSGEIVNRERLRNLLMRLVASGPKAAHVSASECHEIVDETFEVLTELKTVHKRIAHLETLIEEWNDTQHTCSLADFVYFGDCPGCVAMSAHKRIKPQDVL